MPHAVERPVFSCSQQVHRRDEQGQSPRLAAGVSQPTANRYFRTKRDLFGALATLQFGHVTAELDPRTPDELAAALPTIFARALEVEGPLRWTLATPLGSTGRPTSKRRLDMLPRASSVEVDD